MKPKGTGEMVIVPGSDNKGVILPNMLVKGEEIIPVQIVNDRNNLQVEGIIQ